MFNKAKHIRDKYIDENEDNLDTIRSYSKIGVI